MVTERGQQNLPLITTGKCTHVQAHTCILKPLHRDACAHTLTCKYGTYTKSGRCGLIWSSKLNMSDKPQHFVIVS